MSVIALAGSTIVGLAVPERELAVLRHDEFGVHGALRPGASRDRTSTVP